MESIDVETIKESYRRLERAAQNLNACSDTLNHVLVSLNEKFKELSLGISFWHTWANTEAGGNAVGYTRFNGRWGIAVKRFKNATLAAGYEEEVWPIQEAPRWMRIEAVGFLPELIKTGIARSEEMCVKIIKAQEEMDQIMKGFAQ